MLKPFHPVPPHHRERPEGIVVQFGGQTPLKLATALDEYLKKHAIPSSGGESQPVVRTCLRLGAPCAVCVEVQGTVFTVEHLLTKG